MFWLSLLVLMLLIAASPGISMYVEHRSSASSSSVNAGSSASTDPLPKR